MIDFLGPGVLPKGFPEGKILSIDIIYQNILNTIKKDLKFDVIPKYRL